MLGFDPESIESKSRPSTFMVEIQVDGLERWKQFFMGVEDEAVANVLKVPAAVLGYFLGGIGYFIGTASAYTATEILLNPLERFFWGTLGNAVLPESLDHIMRLPVRDFGKIVLAEQFFPDGTPTVAGSGVSVIDPLERMRTPQTIGEISARNIFLVHLFNYLAPITTTQDALRANATALFGRRWQRILTRDARGIGKMIDFALRGPDGSELRTMHEELQEAIEVFAGRTAILLLRFPRISGIRLLSIPKQFRNINIAPSPDIDAQEYLDAYFQYILYEVVRNVNARREELEALYRKNKRQLRRRRKQGLR